MSLVRAEVSRVTGSKDLWDTLHLPRLSFPLLSKTPFWSLMDLAIADFFLRRCWMVFQITSWLVRCNPVYSWHVSKVAFWIIAPGGLRFFAPQPTTNAKRFCFVLKAGLIDYLFCSHSIFHHLVPSWPMGLRFCHYSPQPVVFIHIPQQLMKLQMLLHLCVRCVFREL